jgi:hypothetical protein
MAFTAKFKPVSNQGDWSTWVHMFDRATGEDLDLSALAFQLAAVELSCGAALTGSSSTGELTVPSLGYLQIFFPVGRMQAMPPGSYRVGLTMANGVYTRQLILGLLPIVAGIVGLSSFSPQGDYS